MIKKLKYISILFFATAFLFFSCKEEEYKLGEFVTPANLNLTYEIVGADEDNLYGDGSGVVNFVGTADDAMTMNFDFGDESGVEIAPDGKISHRYTLTDTNKYIVIFTAVSAGGLTSSKVINIEVYSSFEDTFAVRCLTGNSSKTWYWASDLPGHAGMGPISDDYGNLDFAWSNWWTIGAWDSEKACMYEAEFVFTKTEKGLTFEQTQGSAFVPGTYAGKIGVGENQCHGEDVAPTMFGVKNVSFAPSTSKAALEGLIDKQKYRGTSMKLSDGGFMCWYVGQSTYDIISITETTLHVRIEEPGSAAWYHKFTSIKPVQSE